MIPYSYLHRLIVDGLTIKGQSRAQNNQEARPSLLLTTYFLFPEQMTEKILKNILLVQNTDLNAHGMC